MTDALQHQQADWQTARALAMHAAFCAVRDRVESKAATLGRALEEAARFLNGRDLGGGHTLSASASGLRRPWAKWSEGGMTPAALATAHGNCGRPRGGEKAARERRLPAALIQEWHRRCTRATGARNKKGKGNLSAAYEHLCDDWRAGKAIPGMGTWQEWWKSDPRTAGMPAPAKAPRFPYSYSAMWRHRPNDWLRAAGNLGDAALARTGAYVTRDPGKLRKGEAYTLDDVDHDCWAIDDATGLRCRPRSYVMMEIGSRRIAGIVTKPDDKLCQEDVDELIAYVLQTSGVGIGYATHIYFESGTVACSPAAQAALEGFSAGAVKVHRTSMDGGAEAFPGRGFGAKSGHAQGKGWIEAFNRTLHGKLLKLDTAHVGMGRDYKPDNLKSLARDAEALARADILAGERKAKLPLMYFTDFRAAVADSITAYNGEYGHDFYGHGTSYVREIAPGIYEDQPGDADLVAEDAA